MQILLISFVDILLSNDDCVYLFFFSSRRRHTRWTGDWSSDVCSSDLVSLALRRSNSISLIDESRNDVRLGDYLDKKAIIEIGKRRVGKECRSRWSPYH